MFQHQRLAPPLLILTFDARLAFVVFSLKFLNLGFLEKDRFSECLSVNTVKRKKKHCYQIKGVETMKLYIW